MNMVLLVTSGKYLNYQLMRIFSAILARGVASASFIFCLNEQINPLLLASFDRLSALSRKLGLRNSLNRKSTLAEMQTQLTHRVGISAPTTLRFDRAFSPTSQHSTSTPEGRPASLDVPYSNFIKIAFPNECFD